MVMLLAILFELDWMHNGFVALGWWIRDESQRERYTWPAVGLIAAVNIIAAVWEGIRRE